MIFDTGVTTINSTLFYDIDNLESITIGPDVTTISGGIAAYADNLTDIILDPANTTFYVDNNVLYKKSGNNNFHTMIQYPMG